MRRLNKVWMWALVLSILSVALYSSSFAGDDVCTVNSSIWSSLDYGEDVTTLPEAIFRANQSTGPYRKCSDGVIIDVTPIRMYFPIVIDKDVNPGFFLTGAENKVITLDASKLYEYPFNSVQNKHDCAIIIDKGTNVTIKNLILTGVPNGFKGICIRDQTSGARLESLTIRGGDVAVYIENGAIKTKIAGSLTIESSKAGIEFKGTDTNDLNGFDFGNIGETDSNGFASIDKSLQIAGVDINKMIISQVDISVQIDKTTPDGQGGYYVRGRVVGSDLNNLQGILVYGVSEGNANFYGYIGKMTASGFGFQESGTNKGSFNIRFAAGSGKWLPTQVAYIPVGTNVVGKTSALHDLTHIIQCDPSNPNCGSTTPSDGYGISYLRGRFLSIPACLAQNPTAGSHFEGPGVDTDGDFLDDDKEDLNRNCYCDKAEWDASEGRWKPTNKPVTVGLDKDYDVNNPQNGDVVKETCWVDPDSDKDGIPDGLELANGLNPRDTGGQDSDGDGLIDGVEDRFMYFDKLAVGGGENGYLFHMQGYEVPLKKSEDVDDGTSLVLRPYPCDPGDLGVRYVWMKYKMDENGTITAIDQFDPINGIPPQGWQVEVLACRHRVLSDEANFNGKIDAYNIETDPSNVDTDKDSWCDGDGEKCPDSTKLKDPCPTLGGDQAGQLCSKMACHSKVYKLAILGGIDEEYVNINDNGRLTGYKKDGADVKLFKDMQGKGMGYIKGICFGDIDNDGIPDCLEHPDLSGSCDQNNASTGMNWTRKDSDGDGIDDAADMCPHEYGAGGSHKYSGDKSVPECARRYYSEMDQKIAALIGLFRDVDGDNLKDAEEIADLVGFKFAAASESDPFKWDTDGDKINDYLEKRWGVQPRNKDSDGDGLLDGEEIHPELHGGAYPEHLPTFSDMSGLGCEAGMGVDTDPRVADTDGDGISDYNEIRGDMLASATFLAMLENGELFGAGGVDIYTNPRAWDSDGDGIADGDEFNGTSFTVFSSNPCMQDSDNDGRLDGVGDEKGHCALIKSPHCKPLADYSKVTGIDSDGDQLSDDCELLLGTMPNQWDSDGDQLSDGEEDVNRNCMRDPDETDPTLLDTDSDGLSDGIEIKMSKTDPLAKDTDGDGCTDGLEDRNNNGKVDPDETDPLNWDTDGDELADCRLPDGTGEDLNANGIKDEFETDPLNPDTDRDGISDKNEMWHGGVFNPNNGVRANERNEGCSMTGGGAPTSINYLLLMLLLGNRALRRSLRRGYREEGKEAGDNI